MKLSTEYREESVGILTGTKSHVLVCRVDFSDEERAIIQERGLYDEIIMLPAAAGLPTRSAAIGLRVAKIFGMVVTLLSLPFSCAQLAAPGRTGGGPTPFVMLFIGVGLFAFGWYRERQALKLEADPTQTLSIRRLLTKPDFLVHATTPQQARDHEAIVRDLFGAFAKRIRQAAPAPEQNVYEL